jgi:hypothetical protein
MTWTLPEAIDYIRKHADKAFELHYNLALSGSVLLKGESDHDLDIVCVPANWNGPEDDSATFKNYNIFMAWLRELGGAGTKSGLWNGTMTKVAFTDHGRKVDFFVVFKKEN